MLTVAYDGTAYHGYQIQDNGITIEGELNKALKAVTGEDVELIGGSRTDAGVHAQANIVVFDTASPIPGDKFKFALNGKLPEDIRVVASAEVKEDFHPRHCDSVKTYEYRIFNSRIFDPSKRLYFYHTYEKLDIEAMRRAARYIEGEHDFSSFCATGAQVDSKVRIVYSVQIEEIPVQGFLLDDETKAREIRIRVSGNGFLYNMVRIIAGTLIQVGAGRIAPDEVKDIIEAKDRTKAGPTAPANGLTLLKYEFK